MGGLELRGRVMTVGLGENEGLGGEAFPIYERETRTTTKKHVLVPRPIRDPSGSRFCQVD